MEFDLTVELQADRVVSTEGAPTTSATTETPDTGVLDCHICFKPPRDPVATSCGHVFCWPCVHQWFLDSPDEKPCPACRTPLNLDLNILTLYANVSRTASRPTNVSRTTSRPTNVSRTASRPTNISRTASRPTSVSRTASRPTNVSRTASTPTTATASHNVIIPDRPSIPVTFIPAPVTEGYHFGPDVSGAVKALVVLEVLQQKLTAGMSQFLSVFKSTTTGAKKVPLWLVELLRWQSTMPRQISEEEAILKQELNDLKQQKLALDEELAQQLQVEMELEQQLAHRREAREMRPPKKARV